MAIKVCIAAGHGGSDPGAVRGSRKEKDATLKIAKKVGAKLKAKGISVLYTRTKDEFVSLKEQCAISNTWGSDVFLCVHVNAAENEKAEGIETWHYKTVGQKTKSLAANVQTELIAATGAVNRGVKQGTFYVLKHTKAPAVLIECGFISNSAECRKLFNDAYQEKIATAIADGIRKALA